MSTYLFTWNPDQWSWKTLDNMLVELQTQKPIHQWKTSRVKNIGNGDNFLLIKLGKLAKNEKGIVGIGKIVSDVYKDKDVIKNIEQTNFVNLEFSQLSKFPFISLTDLEKIDPKMRWTPESNGNIVPEVTFSKISSQINQGKKQILFEKNIYFPIIAETIDIALTQKVSIHRDEIVQTLLDNYQSTFKIIAKNSNKTTLFIAQNMVDWFSAELTKQSKIVADWQDKYLKTKIKINGREITSYSLALNVLQDENIVEEIVIYKEGSIKQITVNAYERNDKARRACLLHHGYTCHCCGFNFERIYGDLGKNYIHVHHKKALYEIKEEYILDPISDLVPVCANCHAMIHRKNPPLTVDELKMILGK